MLSGPACPAATSLLPETHIAVLPSSRILRTLEEAFARARDERGALPRALNLVSGPSRTADIEQTVTLGAHGPYRVHVILVSGGPEPAPARQEI
jgi:L-lactate dehydrogenase complex protein LldG